MQWENTTQQVQDNYSVGKYRVTYLNENEDMYFFTDTQNAVLIPNTQDYPKLVVDGVDIGSGRTPHTYNGVPVVEFFNNSDRLGDVEKTLDTQDIRDELVSKASTTFSAFSDVILVDETVDEDGLPEMGKKEFTDFQKQIKDYALLAGKWKWLIKDYSGYTAVKEHLQLLEQDIFEGSNSYNPNSLGSDGANATAYQIRQKLKPLIDSAVNTEMEFKKSYRELFRLVLTQGLTNTGNMDYLDLNIIFNHNVPEDKIATLKQLKESGVTVPPELAYITAGFKWDEVEPMLMEQEAKILKALTVE
jgi:SPP1 family phage portal protein